MATITARGIKQIPNPAKISFLKGHGVHDNGTSDVFSVFGRLGVSDSAGDSGISSVELTLFCLGFDINGHLILFSGSDSPILQVGKP